MSEKPPLMELAMRYVLAEGTFEAKDHYDEIALHYDDIIEISVAITNARATRCLVDDKFKKSAKKPLWPHALHPGRSHTAVFK